MNSDQLSNKEMSKWNRLEYINNQYNSKHLNHNWNYKKLVLNRLINENLFILLLQYLGLMISGTVTPTSLAPLWFASGTACGFVFMRGSSILPAIVLGGFLAYFPTTSILQAFLCASLYALQAWLLLKLSYRFNIPTMIFYERKTFFKFLLVCALVTALISYVLLRLQYHSTIQMFLYWWLGNLTGILVFSCGIVTLDFYFSQFEPLKNHNKSMFYLFLILLICNCILIFFSQTFFWMILFSLLTFPITLSFATLLGWCGITLAVFTVGTLLNLAAYLQISLFTSNFILNKLIFIQIILLIEIVIGFLIAIRKEYLTLNYTSSVKTTS